GDGRKGLMGGYEVKWPVVVEKRGLRTDSCGAGKYRGGLGLDMQVRGLVEGTWNFERARRSKCPPWGLWGGLPGEAGGNLLKLPGGGCVQGGTGAKGSGPPTSAGNGGTGGGGGCGGPVGRRTRRGGQGRALCAPSGRRL